MKTKFLKQLLLGAAGLMSLVAGQAFAQSATATVNVSATINGVCRFYSGPINITVEHSAARCLDANVHAQADVPMDCVDSAARGVPHGARWFVS